MRAALDAQTLYREEVERARAMEPGDRLLEGPRLFDRACELMKAGIRHRAPGVTSDEVLARVRQHLDVIRDLEARRDQR